VFHWHEGDVNCLARNGLGRTVDCEHVIRKGERVLQVL